MAKYNSNDILSGYNFRALRGRYFNATTAIKHFYRDNSAQLEPGLEEYRDRLGLPASTSLEDLFIYSVDNRINRSKASTVRGAFIDALKGSIVKDVHRSEITKRGYMESWSIMMGKVDPAPRGRGRPSKASLTYDPSSPDWRKFKEETNWTGSKDDYQRLEHVKGNEWKYYSPNGKTFLISYKYEDDGGYKPIYQEIINK